MATEQFGFLVSEASCVGCKACEVACKNRNELESPGPRLRSVQHLEEGIFPAVSVTNVSMGCMHCAQPACMKVCPAGAISKRAEDGVVLVDKDKCIGCHYCFFACPFGVPQYRNEEGTMIKCDSCLDRRQMGLEPACAHSCFYGGLHAGPLSELSELAKGYAAENLGGQTGPSVIVSH